MIASLAAEFTEFDASLIRDLLSQEDDDEREHTTGQPVGLAGGSRGTARPDTVAGCGREQYKKGLGTACRASSGRQQFRLML